jgi:uncharacterized protein (TIGR02147 family)
MKHFVSKDIAMHHLPSYNRRMQEQVAIQKLLQRKFSEMQASNPKYSLRAFSRKVGLNPGALSGILNGKRNVSSKLAVRIAEKLVLDPQERSELFSQFRVLGYKAELNGQTEEYRVLSAAQFKIVAEWEHFAVLSLMRTKSFRSDSDWIADRLGLTSARVRDVIQRLINTGMVELAVDGALKRASPKYRTTDDIADLSLRRSHDQSLELARRSLEHNSVSERDHTWVMFAMDPKKLSMAKEKIRRFQDELADLVEAGDQTEVYRLSMHFFPLTHLKKETSGEASCKNHQI